MLKHLLDFFQMDGARRYRYVASALLALFSLSPSVVGLAWMQPQMFAALNPLTLVILTVAVTIPAVLCWLLSLYEVLEQLHIKERNQEIATLLSFFATGLTGTLILLFGFIYKQSPEALIVSYAVYNLVLSLLLGVTINLLCWLGKKLKINKR